MWKHEVGVFCLLFMSSCGGLNSSANSLQNSSLENCNDSQNCNPEKKSFLAQLNWGEVKTHKSGIYRTNQLVVPLRPQGQESDTNYCFSNDPWYENKFGKYLDCVNGSQSVRNVIDQDPVLIQSFRFKLNKSNHYQVNFQGAYTKTAILKFNSETGEPVFSDKITTEFGEGCNLNELNSVGFDESQEGSERVLSSMQFLDEYDICQGNSGIYYCNAYLNSGKVWLSGLTANLESPTEDNSSLLRFDFVPSNAPDTQVIGAISEYSSISNSSVVTLPQFGAFADEQGTKLPRYAYRVIIGLCIKGTKKDTSQSDERPLFLGAHLRTYRPKLLRASTLSR